MQTKQPAVEQWRPLLCVTLQWRSLTKEEKEVYEERAKKIADEMAAKQQEADRAMNDSMQRSQSPWSDAGHASPGSSARPGTPGMDGVVFSCWLGCSWVVVFSFLSADLF